MFSPQFIAAVKAGRAFVWRSLTYDYDGADTILTVCNDDSYYKLIVELIEASSDTATEVQIHLPAYATWAGTAVTGVNLLSGGDAPEATAKCDETGQATQGSIIGGGFILASTPWPFWVPVKLGYQKAVGVDFVTAGTAAIVAIYGYYSNA